MKGLSYGVMCSEISLGKFWFRVADERALDKRGKRQVFMLFLLLLLSLDNHFRYA
jgi:hypothetical protein